MPGYICGVGLGTNDFFISDESRFAAKHTAPSKFDEVGYQAER